MEIENNALADQILFEDEEEFSQTSDAAGSSVEELIDKELEGAEYYFTETSFDTASQTLRSILADHAPIKNYPDSLKKLMCFHYVYPIYKTRSKISWPPALGYLIIAFAGGWIGDFFVSLYVKSGLILRSISLGISLGAVILFGYAAAATLTTIATYLRCKEARTLFQNGAQYVGQGNCVYNGKTKEGLDRFSASVHLPFTPLSVWNLIKQAADPFDLVQESLEDMIEKDLGSGILFSVLCVGAALWLLLATLSKYSISLIDFLWFFW